MVTTIPKPLAEYLNIEQGDKINWQTEHSKKIAEKQNRENGDYGSLWNETKQKKEGEKQ